MGGNLRPLCGGGDKQAELAPANKAKDNQNTPEQRENQALVLQKAGSADPEAKFKALKRLISTFFTNYQKNIPCVVVGTSKLQLLEKQDGSHHQGTKF